MDTESSSLPHEPSELLQGYEKGSPTEPPIIASPAPKVASDGDRSRWILGLISYAIGALAFLWIAHWAMSSLDSAFKTATESRSTAITEPLALLYIAKAILVLTVGSVAVALIRTAERLTMPLARYMQLVERQARGRADDDGGLGVLDAITKLVETIRGTRKD